MKKNSSILIGIILSVIGLNAQATLPFSYDGGNPLTSVVRLTAGLAVSQSPVQIDPASYSVKGTNNEYSFTNKWLFSKNIGNYSGSIDLLGTIGTIRGMAVLNGKMLFPDRNNKKIIVVNGQTGARETDLTLANNIFTYIGRNKDNTADSIWTAGVLTHNDLKVDNAGNVLMSNLINSNTDRFQIWKIDMATGNSTLVIDEANLASLFPTATNMRFDAFGVTGDVNNSATIMAVNANAMQVYKWKIVAGIALAPTVINLNNTTSGTDLFGLINLGSAPQVFPVNENLFYVDGNATNPILVDGTGNFVGGFTQTSFPNGLNAYAGHNGIAEFSLSGETYLVAAASNTVATIPSTFKIYRYTNSNGTFSGLEELWSFPQAGMGNASNTYRSAIPAVEVSGQTAKIYVYTGENGYGMYEFKSSKTLVQTPVVSVSTNSLSAFNYTQGNGPSTEQSFKVSGANLTSEIIIPAITNYEISTLSGSTFAASNEIKFFPTNGTVAETTIYVRLKAGLSASTYNENLTVNSSGTSKDVSLSGTVSVVSNTQSKTINLTAKSNSYEQSALSSSLTKEELSSIKELIITGTINAKDFKVMRDSMPALERIDLSGTSISAYSGENGTSTNIGTVTYSLNQLPTRAFYDGNPVPSTKIKSIKIPLNTTTLGANAFNYCQGLDSLFIPSTITNVSSALNYCSANYRVDIANSQYGNVDGVLFRKSGGQFTELVQYPTSKTGNYSIQVGVTKISSAAFAGNSGLSKVTIPTSLSSMSNNNIFNGCASLSQIVINRTTPPSSFTNTFAPELFTQCSLVVPKNTTSAYRAALNWQNFVIILEPFTMVDTKATASVTRNSAILNADIVNLGDSTISAHGFCWNTVGNPTISDEKIDKGTATLTGTYSHNLENLVSNQKYYVRAYVVNETRTVYGEVIQFTTLPSFELTTNTATNVLQKSAKLIGNISYSSPTSISNYGFCWNTTGSPTIVDSKEDLGVNPTAGTFSKYVYSLNGATTYYYRSFATSNGNTVYGSQQSFTTALPDDYDITVQINGNGTVSSGTAISNGALVNVLRGDTKTFTITPNAGYQITAVTFNGVDVYSQVTNNQYTTPAVNAYGTLSVSFGNNTKTINVSTAGTLSTLLSAIDKSIITNLTVTGNIDARDFKCMRDEMTLLAILDLSNVNILTFDGTGGTYYYLGNTQYPANTIPQQSFFYYNTQTGKTTLNTIKFPTTITSIGSEAFSRCSGLKGNLTIPNSVTGIDIWAFFECSNLKNIIIGKSVTNIGQEAFKQWSSIGVQNIICLNPTPPTLGIPSPFSGQNPTIVYVPIGSVPAYKAADGWSTFNIVEPGISTTTPTIDGLIYAPNAGPSDIKSFKVSGGLLTGDITITASADFEISKKSGVAFTPTNVITVSPVDGMVADTTFYVRLKAGLSADTFTGNIKVESTGFTTQNIALKGAVRTTPELINIETAGTLSSLLTTTEKAAITKLTVTGDIDYRDFEVLKYMPLLTVLDLTQSTIKAFQTPDWAATKYYDNQIPTLAFGNDYWSNLKNSIITIKLPATITSIGNSAFLNCTNLKTIVCLNPIPPTVSYQGFLGVNPTIVYVPVGSVSAYKAASAWNIFDQYNPSLITNIVEYKLKTTTQAATNIKLTTVKVTGTLDVITDSRVTAHGFCWNKTGTPTIADSKIDNGTTTTEGAYSNTIDNLTEATTYYVRAYATDGVSGTVYGEEISFTTAEIPATSNLGGNYFNSQYWSKSKSPYTITDNVSLAEGTTLTIEPGVVVNFAGNYEIITLGSVIANGTANDSITFNANGNTCTFLDFKNTKLSDTELSYLKMIGHKILPPLYAKALKTQGTCTDSLTLNNSRIETAEINCQKTVTINNSKIADLSAAASSLVLDNSSINYATFGESWTYGTVNVIIKNSTATGLNFSGDSYNSRNTILNSVVKSSNFGRSSTKVKKSKLYKCNFSANSWENPTIKLDSTILSYTSFSVGSGWSTVTNCIFINDSTQTINLNGVTTKSQFIGDNKLGGVGVDAASGTITNSLISSSKIGALAGSLTINNSNFMNNSQYNIKNTGANTIDAKSNFWGIGNTTTAAVKSTIYDYYKDLTLGKVLYDNYLSTPNIDCPVMSPQNVQKTAVAEGVNYTWNANPESDIKGYKLYYGPFDGFTFANSVDVRNVTTYTLSNTSLTDIVLVTAYDQQADGKDDMIEGHESWYSAYIFPEKAGTITGSTSVCQGETSKVYTVPAIANATSYSWTLPVGATGTSTTNSIAVDFSSTAISGEITVKGQNDFGDGAVSALPITVNSVPTLSGAGIMGMNTVNQGQNSVSYDVYYSNATSYKWTLPEGATGTSTTNNITVNYSTSAKSGNITVTPINDCGEGAPTSLAITVRPLPGAAGTITGSANVCAGQSSVIYTVPAIENATSYIWTLPDGTYGYSSTNSITVNYYTYATSGNITVKGHNSIGNGTASILAVTVTQPVGMSGAEAVSGPKTVCLGEKSVIYTTPLVDNATMYEWTLPTGVTGTSSTNSITVDFGPTAISGSVFVKAKNSCFEGYGSGINVVVVQPIGNAGTIAGEATVCQGENNVVYTVPAIDNATSYEWTLPTGATGTSTTNSISVNFAKTAISGNISVKGTNSCGTGLNSTIAITVNPLPADAGIITGKTSVCQGESSVTYTVPAIQNATSYIWYLPNGASGSSTTNSIDVDFNNSAVSGDIMVTGHNDCGDGVVSLLPITINQLPVISANDKTVICGGSVLLDPSINYTGSGTLEYSWSPTTGLNDATIANPTATLIADKTYTLTVKSPSGCTTSRNVAVTIIPMSKPNICMVGVHSSNKNIVVWEKPVSTGIDSYNIYRETNVTNVFDKIGSIPYNSTSVFIDNSSSPDVQSNSYKLTIVDKLGYESEQSNLHKTMHLSINKGLNATWNLNWEKYEGFTVSTYNVYRGTTVNNLALIGSTSGSSSQYSDVNAPTGDVYYQLEVVNPNPCTVAASLNASKKVKNLESSVLELYSSSRSNIATNVLSGINNNNASGSIKIYPNPVHNELRLEYDGNARFEILNLVGQVLYNGILVKTALVETSNLFPGVYLIRFTQGKAVTTERFIKK